MGNKGQGQRALLFEVGMWILSIALWAFISTHAGSIRLYSEAFLELVVRQIVMHPQDTVLMTIAAVLAVLCIKEGGHPRPA